MGTLWKERYKIGDEVVDSQHRELFERTEHLLKTIQSEDTAARKEECINTILFLKIYAIEHFAAEEKYQESVNYKYLDVHRKIHEKFTGSVREAEKKMLDSDFSMASIKEFTGFLTAWLTYHVAGADQKIRTGDRITDVSAAKENRYVDFFMISMQNLLATMFEQNRDDISIAKYTEDKNAVHVRIKMVGDFEGEAILSFPRDTVLNFVNTLTLMEYDEVDEMAYSVLSEMSNIVCGNVATLISSRGLDCEIEPPLLTTDSDIPGTNELFCFDTNQGQIAIKLHIGA